MVANSLRTRFAGFAPLRLARRAFPPDPAGLRLHDAFCATAAGLITLLVTLLVGWFHPMPPNVEVFGFASAVFVAASVRDATDAEQRVTTALGIVPMAAMMMSSAFLSDWPVALDALLVVLIGLALYAQTLGPRWAALLAIAVTSQLFGVLIRPPVTEIVERLVVLAIATASVYLMRFYLWHVPAESIAGLLDRDVRRRAAGLLAGSSADIRAGLSSADRHRRTTEAVDRLSLAVRVALIKLASSAAARPLANRLIDLDFAVEGLARAAARDHAAASEREAAATVVDRVREAVLAEHTAPKPAMPPIASPAIASHADAVIQVLAAPMVPVAAAATDVAALQREARLLATRQAVQACLAVVAAIAAGHAISATRWYWAAFTAFLIFQGAKSRQETTAKAMQTVAGTILGVLGGLLVATLLHGHSGTTVVATILAVFLAYYASTAAYATMIFWFTIVIGLVFGMLGYFPPSLLALRLEETLIGTACGLASAFLLRIDQAADPLDVARRANLEKLRALVSSAVAGLCQADPPPLDAEVAAARRSLFSLASIALPRMQGLISGLPASARRSFTLLRACNHWAEELAFVSRDPARRLDNQSQQVVRGLGARVDSRFAEVLDGHSDGGHRRSEPALGTGDVSEPIIRLLQNLENGLERLAALGRSGPR